MPLMDLGDASIHYEVRGSCPLTFVFCHGLGSNGQGFERDDMDWYAQHFRTISWDNRGLGRSGASAKYSLPAYAGDLARLLKKLDVTQAVVMGVSWGGVVVQRFALDYPEMCAAIVLDSSSSESNPKASDNWYMRGEVARPHAAGQHDLLGLDRLAALELDAGGASGLDAQRGDARLLHDRGTAQLGSLGERPRQPGWLDLAVIGYVEATDEVVAPLEREEVNRLLRPDQLDAYAEVLGHRAGAAVLRHALCCAGDVERAALAPADGFARLGLKRRIEVRRAVAETGERAARAQAPDHASRVPRGATSNRRLLKHDDVTLATLGQVVGDAGADHASADDDDACASG